MVNNHNVTMFEAIARQILKNYDPMLLNGPPTAIPIEKIAQHLGLCIEYQCLRKNGLILGETIYDDAYVPVYFHELKRYDLLPVKGRTIILDESLLRRGREGRLRFTCAHEIAHWVRHKDLYAGTGQAAASVNPNKSSEENPYVERQADILGTAMLMPTGQVKKAFYTYRGTPEINAALAELFGVSKQAMGIFLKDHRLL
jgi:hypothetical protein